MSGSPDVRRDGRRRGQHRRAAICPIPPLGRADGREYARGVWIGLSEDFRADGDKESRLWYLASFTSHLPLALPMRSRPNMASTVLRKMIPRPPQVPHQADDSERGRGPPGGHPPRGGLPSSEAILRDVESSSRGKDSPRPPCQPGPAPRRTCSPKVPETTPEYCCYHESSPLPIPPRDLWLGYGRQRRGLPQTRPRAHRGHAADHRGDGRVGRIGRPILDFAAAGRMIRWLHDLSDTCEIWGTDINLLWVTCAQYLSPPISPPRPPSLICRSRIVISA